MLTASTPGAPPFDRTFSHAPKTRRFETSNDFTFCFDLSGGSSSTELATASTWPAQPLRSSPITGPSPLLRAVPPLCLASVLCPSRYSPLGVLPLATSGQPSPIYAGRRYRDDRFSTSMPAPATSSRHLYTGHRQSHTQAAPWLRAHPQARLCPEDQVQSSVLMPSLFFSMRQQWFTHVRLLVAHLTRSRRAFSRHAHHDGS